MSSKPVKKSVPIKTFATKSELQNLSRINTLALKKENQILMNENNKLKKQLVVAKDVVNTVSSMALEIVSENEDLRHETEESKVVVSKLKREITKNKKSYFKSFEDFTSSKDSKTSKNSRKR